jgi:hypothetical protein
VQRTRLLRGCGASTSRQPSRSARHPRRGPQTIIRSANCAPATLRGGTGGSSAGAAVTAAPLNPTKARSTNEQVNRMKPAMGPSSANALVQLKIARCLVKRKMKAETAGRPCALSAPFEQDDFSLNRHPTLASGLSMIFSENRCTLFGIML